jgi:hypothetical protein
MAIATKTQYWSSRMRGGDPTSLSGSFNADFTLASGSGSASGGDWVITNGTYSIAPTGTANTLVAVLEYTTAPDDDTVLMSIDDGSKRVEVRSTGNNTSLKLVGTTTVTISDLDLAKAEDNPTTLILRLTLDGTDAKLYTHEIINDDDGTAVFASVTAANTSSTGVMWGNTSGSVKWGAVYYSKFGAFAPDELLLSDFAQDTLARMGIAIVNELKNSDRTYLKTQVDDSSIVYGYDLSMNRISRMSPPFIHVLVEGIESPTFDTLGGTKVRQEYDVRVLVTTRGTNYEDAYRSGLNIVGEVFDQLYTNTGVLATTDSIIAYNADLDVKLDDDDTVCTHQLTFTYQRLIDMRHR